MISTELEQILVLILDHIQSTVNGLGTGLFLPPPKKEVMFLVRSVCLFVCLFVCLSIGLLANL